MNDTTAGRKHGNILVIGNSGVGKSTLINAVLGEERAETGFGTEGTSKEIRIYDSNTLPFRVIDTIGFEPPRGFFNIEPRAVKSVREWSVKAAEDGDPNTDINVIWFCIDGTAAKLFPQTIKDLLKSVDIWKNVPILAVITKSYSRRDREANIRMVEQAFEKVSKVQPRKIIPVVAEAYYLDDVTYAPPEGLSELIEATNELLPEGVQAAGAAVSEFNLRRKRSQAQTVTAAFVTAAATVGAVPVPFADAALLGPLEVAEINGIAKIYELGTGDQLKLLKNTIIEVGTVSAAAKSAISALKAIPGLNIATSVLNAVIAGTFAAALGEGSIYIYEQIYLGKRSPDDIDWVKQILEGKLGGNLSQLLNGILQPGADGTIDVKAVLTKILEALIKSGENSADDPVQKAS